MNKKNHISISTLLRSIMMILMMGWMGNAWGQETAAQAEKVIYSTDFQDWDDQIPTVPAKTVTKHTKDGQTLTFSLNNILGTNDGTDVKFTKDVISLGYLRAEKENNNTEANYAYIETSVLKSVTKVKFVQAGTGGNGTRGWGLKYKVEGSTEWTTAYSTPFKDSHGEEITVNINQQNVQLRFYNLLKDQNTYMTSLEISGNVTPKENATITYYDTDGTTQLGTQTVASGTSWSYQYDASKVTLKNGEVFRGWFTSTSESTRKYVAEGSEILTDLNLYAIATPKEEAEKGTGYTYNLNKSNWRQEEHELISIEKGAYKNKHGWEIPAGGTIKIKVAQQAIIKLTTCNVGDNGTITVTDDQGNTVGSLDSRLDPDGTQISLNYEGESPTTLTFTMSSKTYIHLIEHINFKPVYVSFSFPNAKIEGKVPETLVANKDNEVTMPTNALFYREGWTFDGWTDGENIYEGGKTYVFQKDVTLTPKMHENETDLTDTNEKLSLQWDFDWTKAPELAVTNDQVVYTNVASINGKDVDVKLQIDATNGRIDNTDTRINALKDGAEGALVANNTKFTIPAVYGMEVKITASEKVDDLNQAQTLFGSDPNSFAQIVVNENEAKNTTVAYDSKQKYVTFTYKGDATSLELTLTKASKNDAEYGFLKNIVVTYPVLPNVVVENVIEKDNTDFEETPEDAGTYKIESASQIESASTQGNTGKRFKVGDKVTIIASPNYGYQLKGYRKKGTTELLTTKEYTDTTTKKTYTAIEYTVGATTTTIEAVYEHQKLYKVTTQVTNEKSDSGLGKVIMSPAYKQFSKEVLDNQGKLDKIEYWFTEGTTVTASAEISDEYYVEHWSNAESNDILSTNNVYTFKIGTTDLTLIAFLKKGTEGTVTFDYSAAHVNGATTEYKDAQSMPIGTISKVKSFTIPTNYTFFKNVDDNGKATNDGYTLTYWEDKDDHTRYEIGNTYSFKKDSITLIPHFEYNPTTQNNRLNNPVIRYDFGRKVREYNDPTSKETRKVCAQEVNIGSNVKTFWTSKVYVDVLEGGKEHKYYRDVAMWCDTGKKGFIRNNEFDDWAAFGPGTTFWFTAGTGTKISILSYSPITSTTIDGVVPTLDEERTQEERAKAGNEHMYVYTYTTQNPTIRIPIIIGDDYSYYQWFEMATPSANLVNLHMSVDNEQHGEIGEITTTSEYAIKELEDGGYAIQQGDLSIVSFERKFGFELDKIVETNNLDANGDPLTVLEMLDNGTVKMIKPDGTTFETVEQKTDKDGNKVWGVATGDNKNTFQLTETEPTEASKRTHYELRFEITQHRKLEIRFKVKPTYYVTYNGGPYAAGAAPTAEWLEAGDSFTIPQNRSLYYEGHTLDHWIDSKYQETMADDEKDKHSYQIGQTYQAKAEDLVLYPVFVANAFTLLDIDQDATATWHFAQKDGAPEINYEKTNGILVTQLQKGDKQIDLKLDLIGVNGKFNNTSNSKRVQINGNSNIQFPATPNCVIKLTATGDPSSTIIAGKRKGDEGYTAEKKSIEVTYQQGAADTAQFTNTVYAIDFMVTYKQQDAANKPTIQSLTCGGVTLNADEIASQMASNKCITFEVSPWDATSEQEAIPDVTGTISGKGKINATKATVLSKECTVTITTEEGIVAATYPVKFNLKAPTDKPQLEGIYIGSSTDKVSNFEAFNAPRSGAIRVRYNRTMAQASISDNNGKKYKAESGKELVFKYWDLTPGETYTFSPTDGNKFKDIYGIELGETKTLTLHIMEEEELYHHHTFDFVVGKDGDINAAIQAADKNTQQDGHRYFIFVPDGEYELTGYDSNATNRKNGVTTLTKPNISLIGQSKEGVVIWNKPTVEGLKANTTLHLDKTAIDFYAQDLTLENRFNYGAAGSTGRAAAFHDQGNRTIMKNVALKSWQDTYHSNNASQDYRSYFENSDIYGVVDFICGDGDIWFEHCNLIHRDRGSNNIVAAEQEVEQDWGYVFNNCHIKTEVENPQLLKDYNWTLGRPWNNSPACTFLNTTMETLPKLTGWGKMEANLVVRYHEYQSMDKTGTPISLSTRSTVLCTPASGSDECVLSDELAATYTQQNVLGGMDGFEPTKLSQQIDAKSGTPKATQDYTNMEKPIEWDDNIMLDDDNLQWDARTEALCYFLFKLDESTNKWIYQTNTTACNINLTPYGSGYYCVRAANQRGGLGSPTKTIQYVITDPYELEIKQVGDEEGYGWSTICLPFNAKIPEGVKVYAATPHQNEDKAAEKVTDFLLTLTEVTEAIDSLKGYVVHGPIGTYTFKATSRTNGTPTVLIGNATDNAIATTNVNSYVLAYKSWGLGFYKYTGSTLASHRAWLPSEMVSDYVAETLSTGKRCIRFVFANGSTAIRLPVYQIDGEEDTYYNLSGQQIETPGKNSIYISKKKKGKFINK